MTLLVNIGTAFIAFVTAVWILSSNYKRIWPAPNYVTHSATYDFIYKDIALNLLNNPIDIEYSYKISPIATCSSELIEFSHSEKLNQHQLVLEKQSNLHHLLHIPAWALVPDRISSHSGSVKDLYTIFDSLSDKQQMTLSSATELIETISTDAVMKTHLEKLSVSERYWIKNMSSDLFNSSQTIFSYQLINYADEIQEWVQNNENSNVFLRSIFERTRGWPLLYNPSIKQQNVNLSATYYNFCDLIIQSIDAEDEDDDDMMITHEQCQLFLDTILPWMPDRSPTLTTMWPTYYDVDVGALKQIKGINSPYTLVIKQNRKPMGEVLHYVSAKGDERIQVEWFNEKYHLRATNLAFVRRIRIQIKRICSILKNSVTLSGDFEDADDELAALWASLEGEDEDNGPKPSDRHIEQLPFSFKQYIKNYANELEKGQFDNIIAMDLAQNEADEDDENDDPRNIFIHGLPSIAVFNDGGIKRAWNFILGIIDHDIVISTNDDENKSFIDYMDITSFQSTYHRRTNKVELEIMGVWPYAVGGYLRAITPEITTYRYPPYKDVVNKRFAKQRCVLLLDVLDKLYSTNMRQIGIQRLKKNDNAKLLTLKSTVKYLSNSIKIEHEYFNNRDDYNNQHTLKQGVFIRLAALIQCAMDNEYGCLLSGIMYHIIEAFNRNNQFSMAFIAFLQNEELIKWDKNENGKDVINVIDSDSMHNLLDTELWDKWKKEYFDGGDNDDKIENILNLFSNDNDNTKLYNRMIRHVSKYAVVRRPGEDTFSLDF